MPSLGVGLQRLSMAMREGEKKQEEGTTWNWKQITKSAWTAPKDTEHRHVRTELTAYLLLDLVDGCLEVIMLSAVVILCPLRKPTRARFLKQTAERA